MAEVLIAYYNHGEVQKVVDRLKQLFIESKHNVEENQIQIEQNIDLKKQFKLEKDLTIKAPISSLEKYDLVVLGTPIVSFSSLPAVNAFIRSLPKCDGKRFVLFATGIGLPGSTIKKMQSLLSMKGAIVEDSQIFSSIFMFDAKKIKEVEEFYKKFSKKIF
ncbi:MAG: hypothetical protein AABW59_02415 [archaeon]